MNLVFFDRTANPTASGLPLLSIEPQGPFVLSSGAVLGYTLGAHKWVSLAEDTDTHTFYLVFGEAPGRKLFPIRLRDKKSQARAFTSSTLAKRLCQAFGLDSDAKRLRLQVGAPITHEAGPLYPLHREGAAVVPAVAAPESTVSAPAIATEPALEVVESASLEAMSPASHDTKPSQAVSVTSPGKPTSMYSAEQDAALLDASQSASDLSKAWGIPVASLYARRSYLKKKPTAASVPAATPFEEAAIEPEQAVQPRKTFGLQARAEELTIYWKERELSMATPNELGEVLNLLRHVARDKRGFEMDVVLERAEKEHTERLKGAGKGGNRG